MTPSPRRCRSTAQAASRLLNLLHADSREPLGAELDRIQGAGGPGADGSGLAAERWELLQAVAQDMRADGQAPRPARLETCVRLLKHLAGNHFLEPAVKSPRARRLRPAPSRHLPTGRLSCCRP